MSDEIKGIAVLNDLATEQVLFVVCVPDKANRKWHNEPWIQRLPVHEVGKPGAGWTYRIDGGLLHMAPSVLVRTTRPIEGRAENEVVEIFHNAGIWSVPFARYSEHYPARTQEGAWTLCEELNRGLLG